MLWRECLASLAFRYPGDGDGERPGPAEFRDGDVDTYTWRWAVAPTREALHSLIRCYIYQSCEHPEWERSAACRLAGELDAPLLGLETDSEWWGPPLDDGEQETAPA